MAAITKGELLVQVLGEQIQNSPVLIEPTRGFAKAMGFDRIHRHFPIFFLQFDESLYQAHGILEEHIVILHTVGDE